MEVKSILFESGKYALINRGKDVTEYAVVYGLNKTTNEWDHTVGYFTVYKPEEEPKMLLSALDLYISKTNPYHISKCRLEQIATMFKDRISELEYEECEDDEQFSLDTLEFMAEELELTDVECDYFGIDKNQFRHNDLEIEEV